MSTPLPLPCSIYRHFKGNLYEVICIAKDSETLNDTVVYRDFYDSGKIWVRPLSMWLEQVEKNGKLMPRFDFVATSKSDFEKFDSV